MPVKAQLYCITVEFPGVFLILSGGQSDDLG